MKFLVYIFLFLFAKVSFAQDDVAQEQKKEIFTVVEYMPEYPGGINEMIKFIQNNIVYPQDCKDKNIGGKVFLKFIVATDGKIENVIVLKGSGFESLDNEALRVVKLMPAWKPGSQNGKNVLVYFNLPINFSLPTAPFYIFNISNKSENYVKTKTLIDNGKSDRDIINLLENDSEKESNLDIMYNLGVAYYHSKQNKKACKVFNAILKKSDEKITIVNNTKEFIQKYCTN
ncbi:MAG: energy transducer TonB [Bacteroidia bacterium]